MTDVVRFTVVRHLVVQTFFVRRQPTDEPFFEIQLAADDAPKTPRSIFLTRDASLYEMALALEGSDTRVDAAWRPGRRPNGQVAQLLVAVQLHREAA